MINGTRESTREIQKSCSVRGRHLSSSSSIEHLLVDKQCAYHLMSFVHTRGSRTTSHLLLQQSPPTSPEHARTLHENNNLSSLRVFLLPPSSLPFPHIIPPKRTHTIHFFGHARSITATKLAESFSNRGPGHGAHHTEQGSQGARHPRSRSRHPPSRSKAPRCLRLCDRLR